MMKASSTEKSILSWFSSRQVTIMESAHTGSALIVPNRDRSRLKSSSVLEKRKHDSQFQVDSDSIPCRTTLIFLGVIGGMPFTWKKPHTPSLHPTKSTLPLAFLIYVGISFSEYGFFTGLGGNLLSRNSLQEHIMGMEIYVMNMYHFVTLTVWSDVPALNTGISIWIHLGELFEKVTGERFIVRLRTVEKVLIVAIVLTPTAAYQMGKSTMDITLEYAWAPALIYNNTIVCCLCVMWTGQFVSLENIARDVNKMIKNELRANSLKLEQVTAYREMWLEMRSLTDVMTSLNAPILICILNVTGIVFFTYNSILLVELGNYTLAIGHTLFTLLFMVLMVGMARRSQYAIEEINCFYSNIFALESVQSFKGSLPPEVFNLYFTQKSRTLEPSFGGFVLVNKSLVTSILGAITTYLVILVQFFPCTQIKQGSNQTT